MNDAARYELAKVYRQLMNRYGFEHLLRRMKQGWLVRAAHARVEDSKRSES